MKTSESLQDCITFHKRTVFSVDAGEQKKSYLMGSVKKPHRMSVKQHVSRFETMNGYISLLPTLQDSSLAVASTKRGDVPFNNATLAIIVLATCHINWRNQYKLNHKTILESTRLMLHDLETIEKVSVEKIMRKPMQVTPRLAQPPGKELVYPARKGMEAVWEDQPPRRHVPPSTANGARRWMGPIRPTILAFVVGLTRTAKR